MISETGDGLSVLIVTEPGRDWQTFATWYSFTKNLPDAPIVLACQRNGETPFSLFQWARRLGTPIYHHNRLAEDRALNWLDSARRANHWLTPKCLIVEPLVMAIDSLDGPTTERLAEKEIYEEHVWYLNEPDVTARMDEIGLGETPNFATENTLCPEAKETTRITPLVSYKKGCGRWINTSKGCPFSCAGGLMSSDMTAAEHRVNDLWRQMVALYNAVM